MKADNETLMTISISTRRKVLFWLISFGVFIGLVVLLKGILMPFVASLVLAYFFDPLVEYLEKKGLSRIFAILVLIFGFLFVIIAGLAFLIPLLEHQIISFANELPKYINNFSSWAEAHLAQFQSVISPEQISSLKSTMLESFGSIAKVSSGLLKSIISGSIAFFNIAALMIITPVVCFYVLRDWKSIKKFFKSIVPAYFQKDVNEQVSEIDTILSGFIRGQAMVCLCLAAYYSIALTLAGLDTGILVGLSTGILSFIPYIGCGSGFIISMLLGLAQFPDYSSLIWIVMVFAIGSGLEGYILTPNLVGNKTHLHPVWIMFALLAGGYLFGFLGILLAVPMAAVIGVLVRFSLQKYYQSSFYIGFSKKPVLPHK